MIYIDLCQSYITWCYETKTRHVQLVTELQFIEDNDTIRRLHRVTIRYVMYNNSKWTCTVQTTAAHTDTYTSMYKQRSHAHTTNHRLPNNAISKRAPLWQASEQNPRDKNRTETPPTADAGFSGCVSLRTMSFKWVAGARCTINTRVAIERAQRSAGRTVVSRLANYKYAVHYSSAQIKWRHSSAVTCRGV